MRAPSPRPARPRERRSADLVSASHRVLWPLVKLMLHRGISYPTLAEVLRIVFVQVAANEFPAPSGRETDSRISVLTGIYRRDVKRLRAGAGGETTRTVNATAKGVRASARLAALTPGEAADAISLASMVTAVWTGKPEYLDGEGNPKPLARLARKGGRFSFESLVRSINRDVRPRVLLDEWLRRGAVTLDGADRVCLNLDAFMASKALDDKSFYFAQNIHDHLAAVVHNLIGEGQPFFERCTYYGRLTEESVAELEQLAHDAGMEALHAVNRRALELQKRDKGKRTAQRRMNFGMYFFSAGARKPPRGKA